MARILAYTSPGRSHLFPLTPILDEFHRRGHEVVMRTLASQVAPMRERGFDAAPISVPIEGIELDDWRARNTLQSVRENTRVFSARAEHDAPDLTRAIANTDPAAVLVDINTWGALMAAEAWGAGRPRAGRVRRALHVEVARVGTRLPARRLRPDRLRAKVREAMARSEGARRIAAAYAATGGPGAAADAVETRLLRAYSAV